MPTNDLITLVVFAAAILLITPVLGRYIAKVMEGERTFLSPILRPIERGVYRVCGIDETVEQGWKGYAISVLLMALFAIVVGYVMLRLQDVLPLNPGAAAAQTPDLAFNTSVSFETNTNWQNYSGETGASYLIQMTLLAVRNFTSAATGLAVAIALVRGLTRRSASTIGNYWVDMTRGVLYILLPDRVRLRPRPRLAGRAADVRCTGDRHHPRGRAADARPRTDRLAGDHQGAGQQRRRLPERQLRPPLREPDAADQLPRDGGHVRHPLLADLRLRALRQGPAPGLGPLRRHGRRLPGRCPRGHGRRGGRQPALSRPASTRRSATWRAWTSAIGAALGGLWAAVTTSTSTGAINAWHDSFQPIAGLVPLFNMRARRDHPGRHRRRPLRHARHRRHPLGLHRRADGRPHARVPGQEGRGLRDEDGDARRPRPGRQHPGLHRHRLGDPGRPGRPDHEQRAARLQRDALCLSAARPATTARPSAG